MHFKLKKADIPYYGFLLLFLLLFFHRFLVEIGAQDYLRYTLDIVNIALFLFATIRGIRIGTIEKRLTLAFFIVIASGTIAAIINIGRWQSNILYFAFDCRNLLRFVLFFLSCKTLLRESDVIRLLKLILGFHVINCVYIVYQYFTLEVPNYWMRGDNLNGFFGTSTGGNLYVNALLVFTTIIVLYQRSMKICSKHKMYFFIALYLIIAVLIELKAFFIEIVIIAVAFAWPYIKKMTEKQLIRGIIIVIVGTISFVILVRVLYRVYPSMANTLSISRMIELSRTTTGSEIGRLTFFSDVASIIYKGDILSTMIGVGLGTANTNGEMTQFANVYYSTHYSWYSMPYMLIETGAIGLIAYIYSFIALLLHSKNRNQYKRILLCSVMISVFILFYDEAFKIEAGYLLYFLLALPFLKFRATEIFKHMSLGENK